MDKKLGEYSLKESTKRKSQEGQKYDAKNYDDRSVNSYAKSTTTDDRYRQQKNALEQQVHQGIMNSHEVEVMTFEMQLWERKNRSKGLPTSSSSYATGKERKNPRRKDCKRKEVPIDRAFDHNDIPLWLRNPPKILIQDFSSDYVDDTTFDEEYFDLVQWAFRILEQQCNYQMYSSYVDFKLKDDEPTLLGNAEKDPLKVITAETARVGSTLDYILHPISTGAANVIQTGAKFADFTSRVFRGINFDSIVRKRNDPETPSKK